MAVFDYRASDRSGGLTEGVESAADLQSAARALRARGLTPIVLKPSAGGSAMPQRAAGKGEGKTAPRAGLTLPGFGSRAEHSSAEQVLRFTSELGILLQAGLPVQFDGYKHVELDLSFVQLFSQVSVGYIQFLSDSVFIKVCGTFVTLFPVSPKSLSAI